MALCFIGYKFYYYKKSKKNYSSTSKQTTDLTKKIENDFTKNVENYLSKNEENLPTNHSDLNQIDQVIETDQLNVQWNATGLKTKKMHFKYFFFQFFISR